MARPTKSSNKAVFHKAIEKVNRLIRNLEATQSELVHCAWKRHQCFEIACAIVFGAERPEKMAEQLAWISVSWEFKDTQIMRQWPRGLEFITFASYYVEAASALAVANSFCGTVRSCINMASIGLKMQIGRTDLTEEAVISLWRETRQLARQQLEADKWVGGEIVRDRRIIEYRIKRELYTAVHGEQSVPVDFEGPFEPANWRNADGTMVEGSMGPSAFELVKYLWNQSDRAADIADIAVRFDDRFLELKQIQQYAKLANSFFRQNSLNWSVTTRKNPIAKAILQNKAPVPVR